MEPPLVGIMEPDGGRRRGRPRRRGRLRARLLQHGPKLIGPMRRTRDDRMAGGVAAAVAARFGRDVMLIRLLFVLAALLTVGLPLYVVAWLLLPMEGEEGTIAARALKDRRGIGQAVALASLLALLYLVADALGATWTNGYAWAVIISAAGLVLIWRNASDEEQAMLRQEAEPLLELTSKNRR
jgi:phage shock protein PspC (stress-responsive transcriptional regulator)